MESGNIPIDVASIKVEPNSYYHLEAKNQPGFFLRYITRVQGCPIYPVYKIEEGIGKASAWKGKDVRFLPDAIVDFNLSDFQPIKSTLF